MYKSVQSFKGSFFQYTILCGNSDIILSQYRWFLTKSGTFGYTAVAEPLDGKKKVFKVKFQVLFPAVTRGEHNYKPGTVGNWAHADGSKSKPGTCFFGQSASDVSRRNTETELN